MKAAPPFHNPLPGVPAVESPFFDRIFNEESTDAQTLDLARQLHTNGFAVFDFPEPDFEQVAQEIKSTLAPRFDFDHWSRVDHPRGVSMREQDAWRNLPAVWQLACNAQVLKLLTRLYGKQAWPFQTLNFPVGTQQHFHTDAIHFSSVPERFMCGVWVALEDIGPDQGPLVYYPGSHRWPIFSNEHIGRCATRMAKLPTQALYEPLWRELVAASGVRPEYFHARKGQALIWAANLMHGGSAQRDPHRSRWSQVTHYYFEDCIYYTPMLSDPMFGRTHFRRHENLVTGEIVPHRYAGEDVPPEYIEAATGAMDWRALGSFDPAEYLAANPDLVAARVNPSEHHLRFGIKERRRLRK